MGRTPDDALPASDYSLDRLRVSHDLAAYWALQWGSGVTQKQIARDSGIRTPNKICLAIGTFIELYVPDESRGKRDVWHGTPVLVQGEARRALVRTAIDCFMKSRDTHD